MGASCSTDRSNAYHGLDEQECPALKQKANIPEVAAHNDNGNRKNSSKTVMLLADLPGAEEVQPSAWTKDELECCRRWPEVRGLSEEDIVVVKGAWNRTLAWKDMLMEAVAYRWVELCPDVYRLLKVKWSEVGHDLFTLIDKCVRATDLRTEVHHRESYTAGFPACITRDFGDTPSEILFHYTVMGIKPSHWCKLKDAFLFAMRTHNPYMYQDHDGQDLQLGGGGATARFFHTNVVSRAHGVFLKHVERLTGTLAHVVHQQASALEHVPEFGQEFYQHLLTKHPNLVDYFASTDMDALAAHLHQQMVVVGSSGVKLLDALSMLSALGRRHQVAMVPTSAYSHMGEVIIETLRKYFEMKEPHVKQWIYTYMCVATAISVPMAVDERLLLEAREFFEVLAKEHQWGGPKLDARLQQVAVEVSMTGTYRHTAEELELGARMAWRNSPKCIGRIAWDTLLVRDMRHVTSPAAIFEECKEHLRLGANGGVVQSVMTVFAPRKPSEKWGTRFWNSQFCRYAGYKQPDGSIMGDPANAAFTEMCINKMGWKPPNPRTQFDPLPQIIQTTDGPPMMFDMPRELFCEIQLTHPKHRKFAELGLRWTSIPAITAFNFKLGGVDYPCVPFNGWFVDLEIARNLIERYNLGPQVAKACDFDTSTDSSGWRAMVLQATACAVTHSFQKRHFSIIDHFSVSKQFLMHVDREKRCGREVPAQWSWIGGFAGVHCPVWGYEMRDFYLRPQYHYCAERWVVENAVDHDAPASRESHRISKHDEENLTVLVLFSSTTGTSERYARALAGEIGAGYRPRVMDIGSFNEEVAVRFTHIICCVATFADGSSPLNGASFPNELPFRLENAKSHKPIKYAVMALGSMIYPKFCAFGKMVDKVLHDAGGVHFCHTVLSDETKGHDASFLKFCAAVKVELPPKPRLEGVKEPELSVTLVQSPDCENTFSAVPAEMRGHVRATIKSSDVVFENEKEERCTRKIRIDVSECRGMTYTTGGHLSVLPFNPHQEILALCEEMGVPSEKLHWKLEAMMDDGLDKYPVDLGFNNSSLYDALKWHLDITVRPATMGTILGLLKGVGGMTQEEYDSIMKDEKTVFDAVRKYWWASRLLRDFPKAKGKISLAQLVTSLGKQFPRLYSIASSALVSPSIIEVAVGLLGVQGHRGLASGMLHGMQSGSLVWIATRDSAFCLPQNLEAPIIMAGAGTGVAPFLAFAQERTHLLKAEVAPGKAKPEPGDAMLFSGYRRKAEEIKPEVFDEALATRALSSNIVSLTREPGVERQTLADALRQSSDQVQRALEDPNCHYYCCGDGQLADSAYDALRGAVSDGAGISRARAVKQIERMNSEGRYHLDVWGPISQFNSKEVKPQKKSNMAKEWLASIQEPLEEAD